jgi:transcriptional regulator with GAF, ATPase, and Fis domain
MFNRYKLQSLALYIGSLLCIVLLASAFWSIYLKTNDSNIFWPLTFFILSIFLVSALYTTYLKATNGKILENIIHQKIEEERSKILTEFSKQESKEQETENVLEINEKINQILPKGSFKNLDSYAKKLINNLADELAITQGIIYTLNQDNNSFSFLAGYALTNSDPVPDFTIGENLNGQVAASQEIMIVKDIPDDYLSVESGLGKSKPRNLIIMPFIHKNKTIGILEITTFLDLTNSVKELLNKIGSQASEKMTQLQMA